jgi:hypothetical protein
MERFEEPEEIRRNPQGYDEELHRSLNEVDQPGLDSTAENQAAQAEYSARVDEASERLGKIEGLQPDRWAKMDIYERKATLNAVGSELGHVYEHPAPPLFVEDLGQSNALGTYGDGSYHDPATGGLQGSEYGITINEKGETEHGHLFGDDPRDALRTYAHEFRHSYQYEQAHRAEIPHFRNLVDDRTKAEDWSENLEPGAYRQPESDFDAYRSQPVESDANQFAEDLVRKVYGRS